MIMALVRVDRRAWVLIAALHGFACGEPSMGEAVDADLEPEPPPEPDLRSTYLDVFLDPDTRLCAPTLARLDAEVERLAAALGVAADPETRIVLYYGDVSVKERCDIDLDVGEFMWGGCADEDGLWIAAQPGAESHEIVHALRLHAGLAGPRYWEEGLATRYGTWRPYLELRVWASGDLQPSQSLRSSEKPDQAAYMEAAHFIAFLEQAYGAEAVRALSRSLGEGEEPDVAFEQVLGDALDVVEERWLTEADPMYELGPLCEAELAVGAEPVVVRGEIGCDVEDGLGPGPNARVDVFRGPRYCVSTAPGTVLTVDARGSEEHGVVEVRSVTSDHGCPADEPNLGTNVTPGSQREFETQGCTWSVVYVSSLEGDAYEIELSVR